MRIGIITKKDHPEASGILKDLLPWLAQRGAEVVVEDHVTSSTDIKKASAEEIASFSDVIVVLGGDGTMLTAARLAAGRNIPLLGINLGGLGFITEIHKEELYDAVGMILNGECQKEQRMMLDAEVIRNGEKVSGFIALNDVAVIRGALAKIIDFETTINGAYVTLFKADGIIVSTPTGSTAYSLSAGGPILYPTLDGIVLTPICPHTLTNRPITLPGDSTVEITLKSSSDVILACDGQTNVSLKENDRILIKKSLKTTTLLMPCGRDHFKVLREKLKWGER